MTRFRTIVADPPWPGITTRIGAGGRRANSTELSYGDRLMSVDDIAALDVDLLADRQCHLYLWATRQAFREGWAATVARAWGFRPVGELVWGLRNPGTGSGMLVNGHEPILLASRGGLPWKWTDGTQSPGGVYFWRQVYEYGPAGVPQKVHSAKPPSLADLAEQISPGPRVELFARSERGARLGWEFHGDESLGTVSLPDKAA